MSAPDFRTRRYRIGDLDLLALVDGHIDMDRDFVGSPQHPTAAWDRYHDDAGDWTVPVGCFLIPSDPVTLIDLGFGPLADPPPHLSGGRLLGALAEVGFAPDDIAIVAISHLHSDHIGWIADAEGAPVFGHATTVLGRADWDHFVDGSPAEGAPSDRATSAMRALAVAGRLDLRDGADTPVRPGMRRMAAPGHTPGHAVFAAHDGTERALLLGDAIHCPAQLTHTDWDAVTDVDPALARRTRAELARLIDDDHDTVLGCHFTGLEAGRLLRA
ncbi:MBL fold metallo-hydrolase [Pseudolysinimonas kribbensis]|uniref:MBL fold metallo-hydrolase n=1 Tax=Pseudolysinimonas kribbensis TaxID=433641 RepID=UPI0031DC407F